VAFLISVELLRGGALCHAQSRFACPRIEFFGELDKTGQEGAHLWHSNVRAPGPSALMTVPDVKRLNIARAPGEKFHVAMSDRVSHQSNEIAKRFWIAILRPSLLDVRPAGRSSIGE